MFIYQVSRFPIPKITKFKGRINKEYNTAIFFDDHGTVHKTRSYDWYSTLDLAKDEAYKEYCDGIELRINRVKTYRRRYLENMASVA